MGGSATGGGPRTRRCVAVSAKRPKCQNYFGGTRLACSQDAMHSKGLRLTGTQTIMAG